MHTECEITFFLQTGADTHLVRNNDFQGKTREGLAWCICSSFAAACKRATSTLLGFLLLSYILPKAQHPVQSQQLP